MSGGQPADYERPGWAEKAVEALPGVAASVRWIFRARSRGMAWLGFWIAVGVVVASGSWALVFDRHSERQHEATMLQLSIVGGLRRS